MRKIIFITLLMSIFVSTAAYAGGAYSYSPDSTVVGVLRHHSVGEDETFYEVARLYGIGYNEVEAANKGIDPWIPGVGKRVTVPTKWVLPEGAGKYDIIINLAEMRLYRFFDSGGRKYSSSFPIGVAIDGFMTPLSEFSISDKLREPYWFVPDSVKLENPDLPDVVPPGEDNPLGKFALRLSDSPYFIHGTNKPLGIGKRVSHGCIRLYPEDIAELFGLARLGETVNVIYEPVKVGVKGGRVYMEAHEDYLGRVPDMEARAEQVLERIGLKEAVDPDKVREVLSALSGMPTLIGSIDNKKSPEALLNKAPGDVKASTN